MSSLHTYIARDFELQSGVVLPEARLVCKTHGQLNAARDNAILFPTWFGVNHQTTEWIIGPGRPLDPSRWFIIVANILGNGTSSSPSNTPAPFARAAFPLTTLLDNVRLQLQAVQDLWQIERFAAVIGRSMGAQIAYQWASWQPDMVPRMLALCGSARTAAHNYVFLESIAQGLRLDPGYRGGNYAETPRQGLALMRTIYDSWVLSQGYYRKGLHLSETYPTTRAYLDRPFDPGERDVNDILAQIASWQAADISANPRFQGDFAAALGAIRARSIIMPSRTDLYFPPEDSEIEVSHMRNAELRVIESVWGHRSGAPGGDPKDIAFIGQAIGDLLSDVAPSG